MIKEPFFAFIWIIFGSMQVYFRQYPFRESIYASCNIIKREHI